MPINGTANQFELQDNWNRPFFAIAPFRLIYYPKGLFNLFAFCLDGANHSGQPVPLTQLRTFEPLLNPRGRRSVDKKFFPDDPNADLFKFLLKDLIRNRQLSKPQNDPDQVVLAGCPNYKEQTIPLLTATFNRDTYFGGTRYEYSTDPADPTIYSVNTINCNVQDCLAAVGINLVNKVIPGIRFTLGPGPDCIFADTCTKTLPERGCTKIKNTVGVNLRLLRMDQSSIGIPVK
jgi:hypothetical protein